MPTTRTFQNPAPYGEAESRHGHGLYIHIPFCASRCIYCGFYSTTGLNLQSPYIDALLRELQLHTDNDSRFCKSTWKTIYFGGGTPSTLSIPLLEKLVAGICNSIDTADIDEWTMECNPDDMTPELAQWLGTSPINRISMGAQTFNDARLSWLHRRHTASQVETAASLLRQNGISNISLDLMFGFPGQTLEAWTSDIDRMLSLHPEHISAYSLMYEEGTPLYRMLEQSKIEEISDELSLAMYDALIDRLTHAGYEHYEISNFALPHHRSRHNSSYWQQKPYLGLGAAAHSYSGDKRWWNVSDIREYIDSISKDILPYESENIDETTRYNDIITTALRTREGINLQELPESQRSYLLEQAAPHIKSGKLAITNCNIHLTRQGLFTSDDIMSDLILL